MARLAELQVFQFIVNALGSGQRAILVTSRGQVSARAPEAAFAAFASASIRILHIRRPLPEPPELQERIGAALGVEGCRDFSPLAMLAQLPADPNRRVILAIDDAHTLSHRSLCYLSLMTELLGADEPVLQIVLAAAPALLDMLAQPEFEGFRNRLCRPDFETFRSFQDGEANRPLPASPARAGIRAAPHPAPPLNVDRTPAPSRVRTARFAVYSAAGIAALGCLAAIGYVAFSDFSAEPTWPLASLDALAPQGGLTPSDLSQPLAPPTPGQISDALNPLVDDLADAVAGGSVDLVSGLLEGIINLERSASPDGLKSVTALPDRLAARARSAAAAGRMDEMRRVDQFASLLAGAGRDLLTTADSRSIQSFATVARGASGGGPVDEPPQPNGIAQRPGSSPDGSALSSGPPGGSGDGDRAVSTPNAATSSAEVAPPQMQASAAPTTREGPPEHAAEQLGASGDADRAASPRTAAAAASGAAPDQKVGAAPPDVLASTTPTADESPAAQVVPGLPALAPVRVVLDVARNEMGRAGRAANIQQALAAAGLKVAELVPVDAQRPAPRIGYYFQSDRDAAAGVSHLLEPLLGAVDPVGLRMRGTLPEPGTIEIAIP